MITVTNDPACGKAALKVYRLKLPGTFIWMITVTNDPACGKAALKVYRLKLPGTLHMDDNRH